MLSQTEFGQVVGQGMMWRTCEVGKSSDAKDWDLAWDVILSDLSSSVYWVADLFLA